MKNKSNNRIKGAFGNGLNICWQLRAHDFFILRLHHVNKTSMFFEFCIVDIDGIVYGVRTQDEEIVREQLPAKI